MSDIATSEEKISILTSLRESVSELSSSNESLNETKLPLSFSPTLTTITDEHLIPLHKLCKRLDTKLDAGLSRKHWCHIGDNSFETPSHKIASSLIEKLSPSSRRKKFTKSEWERLVADRIPIEVCVIREGKRTRILGKNLVVGDIVVLGRNDIVPADIRLTYSQDLLIDNRLITGKQAEHRTHDATSPDCLLSPNMVFSCTNVLQGKCAGVVLRTGEDTVFGALKNFAKRVRFSAVR